MTGQHGYLSRQQLHSNLPHGNTHTQAPPGQTTQGNDPTTNGQIHDNQTPPKAPTPSSRQCYNIVATTLFVLSLVMSLLVTDSPFNVTAPFQGMLLPFLICLFTYKLWLYVTTNHKNGFFLQSICLTTITNIMLGLIWLLLLSKDRDLPPRVYMTSSVTFTTGCIDLWLSHHPNTNPVHNVWPCCGWLFRFLVRRPFRGVVGYLVDIEAQLCSDEELIQPAVPLTDLQVNVSQ